MKCRKCKREIPDDALLCCYCAAKQGKPGRRKDGLIERKVTIDHKRVTFYGKSESELIKKIAAYEKGSVKGAAIRNSFKYYAEMLERSWDSMSPNSMRNYRPALKRCTDKFGDRPVSSISPLEIKSFLDRLGKTYAQKTVNTHRSMISQVMDMAVLNGDIQSNPSNFRTKLSGKKKIERKPASENDIAIIERYWGESTWSFLGYFILHTGLRKGEALAIKYGDIVGDRIRVTKSVYFEGNKPCIKSPKTDAGIRTVVAPQCLLEKIKEKKPGDYIFGFNSQHIVDKGWAQFCRAHGMGEERKDASGKIYWKCSTTFHMLRHPYAGDHESVFVDY